jgi:hypothetical protein
VLAEQLGQFALKRIRLVLFVTLVACEQRVRSRCKNTRSTPLVMLSIAAASAISFWSLALRKRSGDLSAFLISVLLSRRPGQRAQAVDKHSAIHVVTADLLARIERKIASGGKSNS